MNSQSKSLTPHELPKFFEFAIPTLHVLKREGPLNRRKLLTAVLDEAGITSDQMAVTHEVSGGPVAFSRAGWVLSYLKRGGAILPEGCGPLAPMPMCCFP